MANRESIVTYKHECAVCGKRFGLEKHHMLHGTANRKLADEDGLFLWLCSEHHTGSKGVHNNPEMDKDFQALAQYTWQITYGKTVQEFRQRYGKAYIGEVEFEELLKENFK